VGGPRPCQFLPSDPVVILRSADSTLCPKEVYTYSTLALLSALFLYFLPTSQAPVVAHEGDTVAVHRRAFLRFYCLANRQFRFVCSGLVAGNNGVRPHPHWQLQTYWSDLRRLLAARWIGRPTPPDSAVDYGTSTAYGSSTPGRPSNGH